MEILLYSFSLSTELAALFAAVIFAALFALVPHLTQLTIPMLYTLANRFGIKGKTLQWFELFLSYRRQAVVVNTKSSSWYEIPFGVPQGSVPGSILFTLHISPNW